MKTYIKDLRTIFQSLFFQWRTLLLFEFLYRVIGSLLIYPIVSSLIQDSLASAKLTYLDLSSISIWLSSPYTFPILLFCFLLLGSYILYEMSVLSYYFHWSLKRESFTLITLIKIAFHKIWKVIKPRNWLMLVIIMVLFPLTSLSLTPASLIRFRIPEYIIDFFQEQGFLMYTLYILIILILNLLVFHMLYVVPSFLLNDMNLKQSWQNSRKLLKKNFVRTLLFYAACLIGIFAFFLLLYGIILLLLFTAYYFLPDTESSLTSFILNYMQLKQIASFVFHIVIFIISFAIITYTYHQKASLTICEEKKKWKFSFKIITISCLEIALITLAIGFYDDYQGNAFVQYNIMQKPIDIVAHRAGSIFAPENTIPALKYAIDSPASFAEIDVQQSKDGQLYIMHDTNFKRTAGVDKPIWEVDADEINTYDAGSFFSHEFKGTKIPTLEDMIKVSEGKIKLMIELKKNGHEKELEEKTIQLIEKYHFEKQCVIASMDLPILKKVKQLNSDLQTVYIAPIAYGNYYDIDYVDMFSVEATFVNKDMIKAVHDLHKKVYVWTVNRDYELKQLLAMNIDGLITDNPELAFYYKQQGKRDLFIDEIICWLFPKSSDSLTDNKSIR